MSKQSRDTFNCRKEEGLFLLISQLSFGEPLNMLISGI